MSSEPVKTVKRVNPKSIKISDEIEKQSKQGVIVIIRFAFTILVVEGCKGHLSTGYHKKQNTVYYYMRTLLYVHTLISKEKNT